MHDAECTSRPSVPEILGLRGRGESEMDSRLSPGVSLALLAAIVVFTSAGNVLVTAQSARARTVWDGVYTDAQATRAASTFDQSCASCHTLGSNGEGPLSGDPFWQGYMQKTVGDLLTYVKDNMPNGNGGSLPASSYNDLVALILKSNGFPAGATELAPETAATVQIVRKDGPGELPANTLVRVVGCLARNGSDWVLTKATVPRRIESTAANPDDATRPLGDRTTTLKFVLTRLEPFVGQRMAVSGLLLGEGGVDGINVTTVNRVAEACQ
jgi:mono/diheme cytochrome c family protein